MILNKIDDPRDNLERAKLLELVKFAHAHGLSHISYDMPAILIRQELRSRRLTDIRIPARPLGSTARPGSIASAPPPPGANIVEVNAAADLARQWQQQQQQPPPPPLAKNGRPPRLKVQGCKSK